MTTYHMHVYAFVVHWCSAKGVAWNARGPGFKSQVEVFFFLIGSVIIVH